MMRKIVVLFIYLFSIVGLSQGLEIKGKVVDTENKPVAFANIVVSDGTNTSGYKGTISNETGDFEIGNLKTNKYTLNVSFLGYKTQAIEVQLDKSVSLDDIILEDEQQELDGVLIVVKKPTVKRMVDRLVFNVENSTLSNNNMLDVLKHTPGVMVNNDGISVKHASPTIYINDRKVHLSTTEVIQLLESMPANNIKAIEVITSPPSKYEAEGGAVLNFVTSKNLVSGYNGSVFGNFKQGFEFPKYSVGTSHFFKGEKIDAYINYNVSPRKDFRNTDEFINFIDNEETTSSWETDYNRTRKSANQNINSNIDYTIDDKNTLSFSANLMFLPKSGTETDINSLTEVYGATGVLDSTFNTINAAVDKTTNAAFTLDYVHKLNQEDEQLSFSAHHTNFSFDSDQDVNTEYLFPDQSLIRNNEFESLSSQDIKLYTGQVDYELPISETAFLEAGGKASFINSESVINRFFIDNGSREEDLENSDTFLYDETNLALYGSYSKDWEHWSLKAGLRTEYTNIEGNSLSTNQINNSDYIKFFPTFHILNVLNENNEIYFTYNKRIYRPRYSQLNPFKFFLSDNSYNTGDPNLKPQIDDNFILGYTFNSKYTFELYYRNENDPSIQITFQDNDSKLLKNVDTNIDRSISYGLDFTTFTPVISNWDLYVYSSLFYYENRFAALESNNQLYTTDKWSVYLQMVNYFSFLKDKTLTADVSLIYISPLVDGPSEISNRTGLDISVRKTFWNNRASLTMGITDIFNTQNFTQTTKYLNQDILLNSRMENRMFTLGFNYKFGNFRLKTNKKDIESIERDRL
ncbi:outer membrane beta-barrel family protein [Algibacter sp. L4_22]|uniref:outer membrane beta-barrel family protein n=1 Tax=Algibacter sp. L4_22 TaxID=2942477 RepID=UPI00201B46B1|nr:outer membrane beta-barrel family protein [Algibacter sp. L4_22]MCL5127838.1 TonB-dependent receptor family protein [Algibacter sp. L4_22]